MADTLPEVRQARCDLTDLVLETEYRTGESNPIRDFYVPCLARARQYDRAVGYFRSSIFAITGTSVRDFAQRGGRIRLVCSPDISKEDWAALQRGYGEREAILTCILNTELEQILDDAALMEPVETLATLIALDILELRIALRPPAQGIFHEKIGIFGDCVGHHVSFKGSSNETWHGWHEQGNLESVEVFCSWREHAEAQRVARHREYFERLWRGEVRDLEVISLPTAFARRLQSFARADSSRLPDLTIASSGRTPLPHQISALAAWRANGSRGILEHATGSGKTFTALLAIREHIETGDLALVVVPSRLLLEQWAGEIKQMLPEAALLIAGGGRAGWRAPGRLERFSAPRRQNGARVILATMATASKEEFRERLVYGDHLLLVADEVHQMGSCEYSLLTTVGAGKRLGLSATPRRYGDPEGTQRLMDYFGGIVPPAFTLRDAIESRRLVQYTYFPHPVFLSVAEAEQWKRLSEQITREVVKLPKHADGGFLLSERVKLLLIQRSRIAKKASGKVRLAVQIIQSAYESGQHWLIYCEDSEQLSEVLDALRSQRVDAKEYHTAMQGDPAGTLAWFERFGGVLVSIRCLDEGVDIPQISHAVILASSQNPRQFIQRRGRVLRTFPGKHVAVVHDAIVVPADGDKEPEQIALARSELARALEFADTSLNRAASAQIRDIAISLGIDPSQVIETGIEEDTADE